MVEPVVDRGDTRHRLRPLSASLEPFWDGDFRMEINTSNMSNENTLTINIPEDTSYCLVCGDTVVFLQRLIRHYKIKHHDVKIIFRCIKCSKMSYNHHTIACHQAKCTKGKRHLKTKRLTCPTCGDQFNNNRGLGQHIRHPAIKHIKSDSAAGPDGINKTDIISLVNGNITLAKTYNLWLLAGAIPGAFKKARTVLLPKSLDRQKLSNINNWRPITIGSLITRLFSKVLYTRLKYRISLNPRQRGFMEAAECTENIQTLQAIITAHKTHQKSLGMVFIDFEKAFDTVSHAYLFTILRIMRLDAHISQLFRDMYSGASTCVENYESSTNDITLMRRVKQGDALSPLLFNIAIDPLIQTLETDGRGTMLGGATITAMAFADDLVIVSNTWGGMKTNLNILKEFCRESGLKLQPAKCKGFFFTRKNRKTVVKKSNLWKLEGVEMKRISSKIPMTYLGINVEPRKNVYMENPMDEKKNGAILLILFNICNNRLPNDVPAKLRDWRQAEFEIWKKLPVPGLGIELFESDKVSNCWLHTHNWMSQRQYIAAIQTRANVFPTRETTTRGRQEPSNCMKCLTATESLSHILGQCPVMQKERIARHHKLCKLLKECEAHEWTVHKEQSIKLNNGRSLRPDLILNKNINAIDLTVRYEFNLEEALRAKFSKEHKHESISSFVKETYGTNNVQTFGIVIGARGKWYDFNNRPLKQIGLSASRILSFSKLMSRRGLLYSLDMLTAFSR
uniref:ribonuclease H n=1 Tax=Erpetoichthys calabaricus TaxID=27687 RepID=A0A8C4TML6_ERPCA